jgi:nifR3 family TIM-barrel protein
MPDLVNFAGRQFLPIMLSPMAGLTNLPYRELCNEYARRGINTKLDNVEPGLFVDEMVAARAVAGKISKVRAKMTFAPNETFRSVQLYVSDPQWAYKAALQIAKENLADHIDLNFGCPVKKVTKNGGGSALMTNPKLLREIIKATVNGVSDGGTLERKIPVSAKFRLGFTSDELSYLRTAQIAVEEGCELLTMHCRTTEQFYSGIADWSHLNILRSETPENIPIFGNGDIWGVQDAFRMLEETGVNGVAIGRGATGRPWLFQNLASALTCQNDETTQVVRPTLGEVVDIILGHLESSIDWIRTQHPEFQELGEKGAEGVAIRSFRANLGPYLKGFPVKDMKIEIMNAKSQIDLENALKTLPRDIPYPESVEDQPRGRTKPARKVYLPPKWP